MIRTRKYRCKESGELKIEAESDKPGYKAKPIRDENGNVVDYEEVEMSTEEIKNRKAGVNTNTDAFGAISSKLKQKNKPKNVASSMKKKREKDELLKQNMVSESVEISKIEKKINKLKSQLKKAELDKRELDVSNKEKEISKKENKVNKYINFFNKDKEKLIDKHSYFVNDEKDVDDTIDEQKEFVRGEVRQHKELSLEEKLNRILNLGLFKESSFKLSEDIVNAIDKRLMEADDEEDEEDEEKADGELNTDDELTLDVKDDGENSDEDDTEEEKDDEQQEDTPNELKQLVGREVHNFDFEAENAYNLYNFIQPKLLGNNSLKALNSQYSAIPQEKRKITPATYLLKKTSDMLDKLDKEERKRMNDGSDESEEGSKIEI